MFILLESGSSAVTRRAAAKQIGEVQKLYPHELHSLLNRLIGYLHSTSWDTRIAASQAVEAILLNVPEWKPELYAASIKKEIKRELNDVTEEDSCDKLEVSSTHSSASNSTTATTVDNERLLSFAEFNLEQILHKGARLIGSEGIEFDDANDELCSSGSGVSAAERLSRQRALLNEKLGLTQASKLGVNLTEMITDEDMLRTASTYNANEEKVNNIIGIRVFSLQWNIYLTLIFSGSS